MPKWERNLKFEAPFPKTCRITHLSGSLCAHWAWSSALALPGGQKTISREQSWPLSREKPRHAPLVAFSRAACPSQTQCRIPPAMYPGKACHLHQLGSPWVSTSLGRDSRDFPGQWQALQVFHSSLKLDFFIYVSDIILTCWFWPRIGLSSSGRYHTHREHHNQ